MFSGDLSHEILKFMPLWNGAVVFIIPFRYQDTAIRYKNPYIFLGKSKGFDVFVSKYDHDWNKYRLWPGTYTCKFHNVR